MSICFFRNKGNLGSVPKEDVCRGNWKCDLFFIRNGDLRKRSHFLAAKCDPLLFSLFLVLCLRRPRFAVVLSSLIGQRIVLLWLCLLLYPRPFSLLLNLIVFSVDVDLSSKITNSINADTKPVLHATDEVHMSSPERRSVVCLLLI